MRLIDADALKENCYKQMDELMESTSEHLSAEALSLLCGFTLIDSAPSIDIVRCVECRYKQQCRKAVEHITHEPTSVTIGYKTVEWCSYGERGREKENGKTRR